MSFVSSMVLTCGLLEGHVIEPLNEWMRERTNGVASFRRIDLNASGGGKAMQIEVYACAVNGWSTSTVKALVGFLSKLPWACPREVVLLVYPEDGPPRVVPFR